jgi:tetratricopeptide (TPR) repeat protein
VWGVLIVAGLASLSEHSPGGGAALGERDPSASRGGLTAHHAVTGPKGRQRSSGSTEPGSERSWPLLAGALTALLVLGWVTADLASAYQDRRGQDYVQLSETAQGDGVLFARRAAAHAYEKATLWMPFEDSIFRRRADALRFLAAVEKDTMGYLEDAETLAVHAATMAPSRSLNHRYVGLIRLSEASLKRPERIPSGEAAYARSLELAPVDALTMMELANAEVELGRPREALAPASRAAELYPEHGGPLATLARVQQALGETEAARATLTRAVAGLWPGDEAARLAAETTLREWGGPASSVTPAPPSSPASGASPSAAAPHPP